MLILRELVPGPRRFKDLLEGLPGIGTGLLSERLRELEAEGIVAKRTLPAPAGSTVYELTPDGKALEPALFGVARWGYSRLGVTPVKDDVFNPRWAMLTMRAAHDPEAALGVEETYEFRIGDEVFHVIVDNGQVRLVDGPTSGSDLVVETDPETFLRITADPVAFHEALTAEKLTTRGSAEAARHCVAIFAPAVAAATR